MGRPKIYLVYQDCPLCGARKDWGEKQVRSAVKNGFDFVKVSFATPLGRTLIQRAVFEHKIKALPFFTDGERFAVSVDELLVKLFEKPQVKKAKKGKKNGSSDKN